MNWILLILAGCLELVFTFCLGKINRVVGAEKYMWSLIFFTEYYWWQHIRGYGYFKCNR